MKQDQTVDEMIADIFILPSSELVENRFTVSQDPAGCSGKCKSGGGCITTFYEN